MNRPRRVLDESAALGRAAAKRAEPRPPIVAYVAVGSNLDPERHIPLALAELGRRARITGVSTFYRTAALGRPEQPPYLNGAVRIETPLDARSLKFDVLRKIEERLRRVRTADKYAPRVIDLDLALYGGEVSDAPDLRLPDPDIRKRVFVAAALLELDAGLILPDTEEALADLFSEEERASLMPDAAFSARLRDLLRGNNCLTE